MKSSKTSFFLLPIHWSQDLPSASYWITTFLWWSRCPVYMCFIVYVAWLSIGSMLKTGDFSTVRVNMRAMRKWLDLGGIGRCNGLGTIILPTTRTRVIEVRHDNFGKKKFTISHFIRTRCRSCSCRTSIAPLNQ